MTVRNSLGHRIELSSNLFRLARLQPSDAEVAVDAGDHTLEQILVHILFQSGRPFFIALLAFIGSNSSDENEPLQ